MIRNVAPKKLIIAKRELPRRQYNHECPLSKEFHEAFDVMVSGESFMVESDAERLHAYRVAKRYGIKITTRKVNGCGYQIQLV